MDGLVVQFLAGRRVVLARHARQADAEAQAALLRQHTPSAQLLVEETYRLPRRGRVSLRDYAEAYRNA